MIVDSHCHLDRVDLSLFNGQLDQVLNKADSLGVSRMLTVCVTMENFPEVKAIAEQYDNVYGSVGKHPTEQEGVEPTVESLVEHAQSSEKIIAIGEAGLDYFHCSGDLTWQQERFAVHIEAAKQVNKPLIIHTRDAREDTLAIMKSHNIGPGIFHCFTESWEMAKAGLDMGMYISFSGIVTFKNAQDLKEVAKKVPLDRLLVETDSPYLTPAPYRGKPNHPGLTRYVAEHVADLRGISLEALAEATTENFDRLFQL